MKKTEEIKGISGVKILQESENSLCGWIYQRQGKRLFFAISWNDEWEHVSLSHGNKIPSWEEICLAKNIFWNDGECVVQYLNECADNTMHLWRYTSEKIPVPPEISF